MSGRFAKYAVPRQDNAYLVTPSAKEWPSLFQRNSELLKGYPKWILALRHRVRTECAAMLGIQQVPELIVVGGHQPELFHPGVWFKNFVLNRIAKTQKCLPLQIQIDHDVVRSIDFVTPCIRGGKVSLVTRRLPTSESGAMIPWENTRCTQALSVQWESVVSQVVEDMQPLGIHPLLETRWAQCQRLLSDCKTVSQVVSQLRSSMERDAGVVNHEIPMSQLASGDAFSEFVLRCIGNASQLRHIYNESRDEFRQAREISNPGQPVPELRCEGEWVEVPFWLYHSPETAAKIGRNSHCRHAAWVRVSDDEIELANAPNEAASIRLFSGGSLDEWRESFRDWSEQGVCVRPRALMTTLFLRLFLGDLFVHGIGGGIYDELTDRIASRMWRIQMPLFLVASAALHLPFREDVIASARSIAGQSHDELEKLTRRIRSAPESLLDLSNQQQSELKLEFDRLLREIPPRGQKREWHRMMQDLRERIRKSISSIVEQVARQSLELIERDRMGKIVGSREFSFALFPEKSTTSRLRVLAEHAVCAECSTSKSGIKLKDDQTSTLAAREC